MHGVPPALASPEELTDNRHFLSTAWFAWNAAWRVVALHKEKKFDVLHGHQLAGGCAAWLASRLTGTPFVLTIQKGIGSNDFLPGQSAIREPVMNVFVPVLQFLLWNANFVHTVSTASTEAL